MGFAKLFTVSALALVGLCSAVLMKSPIDAAARERLGHTIPSWMQQTAGYNIPGTKNAYMVVLDGVTDTDQVVDISCSSSSAYSSLPATVIVPAGSDRATFQGAVSMNPPMNWTLSASCNGGSVSLALGVPAE
jgi:hypothetical protein